MTDDTMPLLELLQKRGGVDFLKELSEAVLQRLMEFEVEGVIGAGRHERSEGRTTHRNGFLDRSLETRLGTLELRIPKLRQGSYFPGLPGAAQKRPSGHLSPSCRRRGSRASQPARSTIWCRRWG